MLTHGIPPDFRGGVHLFVYTAIRHRVSAQFIGSRKIVPMAFTAETPPALGWASSPNGSSNNGCCLCITMDQLMSASIFQHVAPTGGMVTEGSAITT